MFACSHDELESENVVDELGKTPLQYLSAATNLSSIKALNSVEHKADTVDAGCEVSFILEQNCLIMVFPSLVTRHM